jgi:hypothetical protein
MVKKRKYQPLEPNIELKDGGIKLAHKSIGLSSGQKLIVNRIEKICRDSWFRPLSKEKLKEVFDGNKPEMDAILKLMIAENRLIK